MLRRSKTIIFLLLFSLVFLFPLITNKFYLSHDGEAHVARMGAYIKAFDDGQVPIRWAGDLNYKYGSPLMIFYYPLSGIISIPLNKVGFSLENTFKLLIGFSFALNFIMFYIWLKEIIQDEKAAIIGGIIYGLTPYHFLNLYVRGGIAELLALSIVPLVFLLIEKTLNKKNIKYVILGVISYAFLILSHNAVSLLFTPIFLAYSFFRAKNKISLLKCLFILILGLSLSAFFWVPAIFEAKYTNTAFFIGDMFKAQFPSLLQLIYSPWGFGADVYKEGGLSPQIGPLIILISIFSLFFAFKKNKLLGLFRFWIIIFLISILLTISISTPIWQLLPLLKNLQFPWRIVSVSSFAASVLAALFLFKFKNRLRVLFLILLIFYSLQFLKINYINPKKDSFYLKYPGTTSYHGEGSSVWTAGDFGSYPKKPIEIISGNASISKLERKSNSHRFSIEALNEVKILDNTVYFPGWEARVDGQKKEIQFQDPNHRGLITFNVPKGVYKVELLFRESKIRLLSDYLSLISLAFIAVLYLFRKRVENYI